MRASLTTADRDRYQCNWAPVGAIFRVYRRSQSMSIQLLGAQVRFVSTTIIDYSSSDESLCSWPPSFAIHMQRVSPCLPRIVRYNFDRSVPPIATYVDGIRDVGWYDNTLYGLWLWKCIMGAQASTYRITMDTITCGSTILSRLRLLSK